MSAPTTPSLSYKIGQMIMVGFYGASPNDPEVKTLQKEISAGRVGGVIFLNYNIKSPAQTKRLTQALQSVPVLFPLLLAIDQEGGRVQRLKQQNGFFDSLSAKEVADLYDVPQAEDYYQDMARLIAESGFNLNFAPVVDLHDDHSPVIGKLNRAFSSDPKVVAAFAAACIRAHHRYGVLTCLKHYPGHGLATSDSHKGTVDITASHQEKERQPFRDLIDAGLADMIMMAHLMDHHQDAQRPTSLSTQMIQGCLRQQDHFQGIVITDDLMMGAISKNFEEVVVQAILAGNDILLFTNSVASNPNATSAKKNGMALPARIIMIVEKAIKDGKISQSRIDESYQRIVKLRSRFSKRQGADA